MITLFDWLIFIVEAFSLFFLLLCCVLGGFGASSIRIQKSWRDRVKNLLFLLIVGVMVGGVGWLMDAWVQVYIWKEIPHATSSAQIALLIIALLATEAGMFLGRVEARRLLEPPDLETPSLQS